MQADDEDKLKPITERFYIDEEKPLGKGCYGHVYQGYDKQKRRKIAIKQLNRPQNFMDQIQTLQKLSTLIHPNIMGFYGYKADENDVYLFVEYCPGGVLTDLINKGLDQERVLDLFRQIVEGMCYMNAKGRMHRDLKPDNILIGTKDDIKISDFGLSRQSDGIDVTGMTGTPLYAGPEVYTNFTEAYNQNCDVWSAGLILCEMLTKKHPFGDVKTVPELKAEWKQFQRGEKRIKFEKIHPQWEFIVNLMLTYNFKKRPKFHEILELLKKLDDNGSMRKQIQNSKLGIELIDSKQSPAKNYLTFIEQKCDIMTDLYQILIEGTGFEYLKSGSLRYMLVFLSLSQYICRMKKIIRSLSFKTLKYPNDQEVIDRSKTDHPTQLLIDKYRNIFETKCTKYQNLIKQKIVTKICDDFASRQEQKNILKTIDSAYKLVLERKNGGMNIEDNYHEEYMKLLNYHKVKPTDEKLDAMSIQSQQIYLHILLVGFLDTEFPNENFNSPDYIKHRLSELSSKNYPLMKQTIVRLKNQLK